MQPGNSNCERQADLSSQADYTAATCFVPRLISNADLRPRENAPDLGQSPAAANGRAQFSAARLNVAARHAIRAEGERGAASRGGPPA